MINAVPHQFRKRTTTFNPCPVEGVDPLTVSISPDPPVSGKTETYTVSGTLTKGDITADKTIVGIAYADTAKNPIGDPYTKIFTQSFKSGTPFTITADDVTTPQLPDSYFIGVVVGDPTDDPKNPLDVYGCAFAVVGSAKAASYPIAERSYPIAERS
ncbi:hypothetical protein RclHR1_05870003 [Rhizophagus clarus]|uniref:Uncharacterized protein n=1 Tax=Rhizophagus clarus TaxID=94130 RepID=A0A2Z6SH49_9GLOM|nr:hypothetical protein RclHR1_05870003 [Rhizophagus clarus]